MLVTVDVKLIHSKTRHLFVEGDPQRYTAASSFRVDGIFRSNLLADEQLSTNARPLRRRQHRDSVGDVEMMGLVELLLPELKRRRREKQE